MGSPSQAAIHAYGLLGLPLAAAALPLYVHTPRFYAGLGLDLALLGLLLLGLRALDAIQDPFLGRLADRLARRPRGRQRALLLALAPLGAGFWALYHPPVLGPAALSLWLAGALVLTFSAHSLASIAFNALGAELAADAHQRTRYAASREGWALAGVIAAAALPALLADSDDPAAGLPGFSLVFPLLLVLLALPTVFATGAPPPPAAPVSWRRVLTSPGLRRLLPPWALAGLSAAIPSVLVLFYVEQVIQAPRLAPLFLAAYFLAGAAGMPLWVALARRLGKARAWLVGMGASVAAFASAATLGAGDTGPFLAVCLLAGLALGADLALPPSLLADALEAEGGSAGAWFGVWNLVAKFNLALAAGLALPLWALLSPALGAAPALALLYAALPCLLRLAAMGAAWPLAWPRPHPATGELRC